MQNQQRISTIATALTWIKENRNQLPIHQKLNIWNKDAKELRVMTMQIEKLYEHLCFCFDPFHVIKLCMLTSAVRLY